MNPRDYSTLFSYFVGARGNHAVHVRALIHAGFIVDADEENPKKSYVKEPSDMKVIGTIVGEPDAIIGWFEKPRVPFPEKVLRIKEGKGY